MKNLLYALTLWCCALAAPAQAEWLRAESPNFLVYSEGDEGKLRARVQQLEEFDRLLRLLTGLNAPPSPNKLHLYLVEGYGQFERMWGVGSSVGGFYAASPEGIAAVADLSWRQDYMTHEEVLLHEYAHHFMLQYFPAAYPAWYVEGFAEYVSTARVGDESIEFGRFNDIRASWLADRSGWVPLDRLLFGDTTKLKGAEVAKFYAQSWLLVHYLLRDAERRRQLASYLTALSRGEEPRQAFAKTFETNPSSLQRAISGYGSSDMTYSRLPRISAAAAAPVKVTKLPSIPDELVLAQAAVQIVKPKKADLFLRRMRAIAGERDGPVARRVLARAEALHGDGAAADRLLDPLLAAAPADAELLYLKGMRHLVAGRRDEANRAEHFRKAQGWFVRAHRADENHFPTLYRYAESLSLEPSFLSENTTNVLLLAHKIAPQVQEIAYSTANVLMRQGKYDDAATMLKAVAANRHGKELVKAANGLLAKAEARDNRGLPDAFAIPQEDD